LTAITDGARLLLGKQNALEYAIGKISQTAKRDQAIEVCTYLMEFHSEFLTESCVRKILNINDKKLTKGMIQVLVAANEPLCEQLFTETCSTGWVFPIARVYTYAANIGYLEEIKYVRYKPPREPFFAGPCLMSFTGDCTCGADDQVAESDYQHRLESQPAELKDAVFYRP